ncbi:MAG: hypothetical protein E7554_03475 [Ruminococcaceae bacterium]|nr:hypothetical protein [Oscillospiraceae bacterium]
MKTYVNVYAVFDTLGQIMPRAIIWEDGRKFPIDRILHIDRRASLRSGGAGLRYHVVIAGHQRYLYLEETKWFVEPAE